MLLRTVQDTSAALAEVRAIYAELASRPAQRNCTGITDCCKFKLTGLTPYLTKGEALVAAKAFRATGRKELPDSADPRSKGADADAVKTGACPMLHPRTAKCMIYDARPFACRTHFCEAAGGPLDRRDVVDLIRRLEKIDIALGGDGSRMFAAAMRPALDELEAPQRRG